MILLSIIIFSKELTWLIKVLYSNSEQNPFTGSTTARLYQLLSKKTISPSFGKWWTYLWKYHCVFSLSVGAANATILQYLGFKCSVMRLITPPLPAASLPSKIIATFFPLSITQSCSLTNSICNSCNLFS